MTMSASSSPPAPARKRKQDEAESSDGPDASSVDEQDSDVPQRPPLVVSHAERRRQKKKQKQLGSESPRKKTKLEDGTAAVPTPTSKVTAKAAAAEDPSRWKRQNSIWVGNLSFRTTQDALRAFLDGVGTITRIHMPMRRGKQQLGQNMGFAYVDLETPEAKAVAITLSEGQLDGRNLLIKDGNDFTGRPSKASASDGAVGEDEKRTNTTKTKTAADGASLSKTAQKILRMQKQPPAPTLFLGNLGFETTEASIRELFEAHRYSRHKDKGKGADIKEEVDGSAKKSKDAWMRKIRMGTFEDSGACKGFAFVDFTSIEHAAEALVNPRNHRLNGRDLVVEYASPEAVRRGGGGARNPKGGGSGRTGQNGSADSLHTKKRHPQSVKEEDNADPAETQAEAAVTPRSQPPDRTGHDRYTRRARPGAVLAHVQRQSVAIVPSQGQKIVF